MSVTASATGRRLRPIDQLISIAGGGHIPAIIPLEDMCQAAGRYGRGSRYVLRQTANLQLDRESLPKLHEACGYDAARCFKMLLAYEFGFVTRETFQHKAVQGGDEAIIYGLEAMVDAAVVALA